MLGEERKRKEERLDGRDIRSTLESAFQEDCRKKENIGHLPVRLNKRVFNSLDVCVSVGRSSMNKELWADEGNIERSSTATYLAS